MRTTRPDVLVLTFLLVGILSAGDGPAVRAALCPMPGGGAISGRVLAAATGDPVAGARVVAERMVDGTLTFVAATESGPGGHYLLGELVAGDYFVRTEGSAALVDEIWPNVACDQVCDPQSAGTAVPVAANSLVEQIDFTLDEGGRIEGFVRQGDGVTPVPGARVEGWALGPFGTWGLGDSVTGADGGFAFDGLESGSYKVRVSAPGRRAELFPDTPCPLACDVFTLGGAIAVTAGETTPGVDLALAEGARIAGTVTDLAAAPLAGVVVAVHGASGVFSVSAMTDADGGWATPEGLPPGTYYARTGGENVDELWDDLPCEPFCSVTSGTQIVVGTSDVGGVDFALARLGAITGAVVEAGSGLPLAGVTVVARPFSAAFPAFAVTAGDGTYRIGGLAPDLHLVVALDGVHAGEIYEDAGSCYDPFTCAPTGTATPVEVVGSETTDGIDFALAPGGVLAGAVVVAATNAPVAGATVVLDRGGAFETAVYTDATGRFLVAGTPLAAEFKAVAQPVLGSNLLAEVWQEQPCTPGSCDLSAGTPIAVGSASPACLAFTLDGGPQGSGIAGSVAGPSGPLEGVLVRIFDEAGDFAGEVLTGADGTYRTTGALPLAAGTYYLVADGPGGYLDELYDDLPCAPCVPTSGTPVTLVEGETTEGIDFTLQLVGTPQLPLIFLENCKPGGCVYFHGPDNSRTNSSPIVPGAARNLPAFVPPDDFWDELVECVRRAYRPFQVEITDVDPGSTPHLEHVVAGHPSDLGLASDIGGISPATCGFLPNSISFTFAELYGSVPSPELRDQLCWTMVHEIGHQHGLDHHADLPDAMTYLDGCEPKTLPARDVACGEYTPRACVCGGASENSYARIHDVHGPSGFVFADGFEIVEPGQNCAWSSQNPPPGGLAPLLPRAGAPRCGTLDPTNPTFRPAPR